MKRLPLPQDSLPGGCLPGQMATLGVSTLVLCSAVQPVGEQMNLQVLLCPCQDFQNHSTASPLAHLEAALGHSPAPCPWGSFPRGCLQVLCLLSDHAVRWIRQPHPGTAGYFQTCLWKFYASEVKGQILTMNLEAS